MELSVRQNNFPSQEIEVPNSSHFKNKESMENIDKTSAFIIPGRKVTRSKLTKGEMRERIRDLRKENQKLREAVKCIRDV